MRVLVVHNRYRSALPSGENMVVDAEIEMLRDAGVDVFSYQRESDEIEGFGPLRKAELLIRPTFSISDVAHFRSTIRTTQPDIVHLHNVYPLISPGVIRVARSARVPIVQTIHNYRYSCANGLHFRQDEICQQCVGLKFMTPAIRHGCYRGSRAQSAVLVAAIAINSSLWRSIDRFIVLSRFAYDRLVNAGVPSSKIRIKPNATPDPGSTGGQGAGFFFAGRLDPEKGVEMLLRAWEISGLGGSTELRVAGDGPLREMVENADRSLPGVRYLGYLQPAEIAKELDHARTCVVPSLCYENFPRLIVEATAHDCSVVVTNVGSPPTLISPSIGWIAAPTPEGLAQRLKEATLNPIPTGAARDYFLKSLAADVVMEQQLAIYEELLSDYRTESGHCL